jgi:hypothetical protein
MTATLHQIHFAVDGVSQHADIPVKEGRGHDVTRVETL